MTGNILVEVIHEDRFTIRESREENKVNMELVLARDLEVEVAGS